jgi:hypothetical protein
MSHSKQRTVIVIDDSDQEDGAQPALNSNARTPNAAHPRTSRRRKSEPMSRFAPPTNTQTRLRSAKNKPYEIIEVDSDDSPPVSFRSTTILHPYEFNYLQPKRARTDLRTPTPPPVESDGKGAPKVVHGSAVESGHVPPPEHRPRKEFIWDTVSNHVDPVHSLSSSSRHSYCELLNFNRNTKNPRFSR